MKLISLLLAAAALTLGLSAQAQESALRKTLAERIPQMGKIDEVRPTAMQGLYEVRIGTDVFYSDAKGNYLIQGELIDTKARRNLTEDRINKLTAVEFSELPLKDAFTIVRGDGKRKVAVFEDPNCGYCKRIERISTLGEFVSAINKSGVLGDKKASYNADTGHLVIPISAKVKLPEFSTALNLNLAAGSELSLSTVYPIVVVLGVSIIVAAVLALVLRSALRFMSPTSENTSMLLLALIAAGTAVAAHMGGYQDVDAVLELLDLRIDADAAENHGGVQVGVLAIHAHAFFNLCRQFAGRGQDQGADRARGGAVALLGAVGVGGQAVQDGQGEAGGLAGAGLCAGQQVAAVQYSRNRLGLDRRRRGVTGFGDSADDGVRQTKVGGNQFLLGVAAMDWSRCRSAEYNS
eukprot:gene35405-43654_t